MMPAMMSSSPPVIHPDVITSIDMSSLSQSELHSLSLLSNTTTIPPSTVNPPLFNGSSQPCSDSLRSPRRRHRRTGNSLLRREHSESSLIVNFLKGYLQLEESGGRKRKRTRVTVSRNGKVVDLAALAKPKRGNDGDGGPFDGELKRRAAGMEREEELLAMLADMEGDWCSRRKKRRIVLACLLGDALPVGWKLIIALRRKGGRYFPYCHRYISPTGKHIASCREVSSYLKSYIGISDTSVLRNSRDGEHQQIVDLNQDFPDSTIVSNASAPIEPDQKDVYVSGTDNLQDVQVSEFYECHPCNVRFDVKDKYLQHLMSLHRNTTKKYRLGSSVGAGVIIRDGKFECQFCHKVFEEKRRYFGHVGNHVRGSARSNDLSTDNASVLFKDQLPTNNGVSRMAATLIEIAQNPVQDISPSNLSNADEVSLAEDSRVIGIDFKTKESLSFCLNDNSSKKCTASPNETEMDQNTREDNDLPKVSNPSYDIVSEILMTNNDMVNDSSAFNKLEMGKDYCKYKYLSKEMNPCSNTGKISTVDGNTTCSSVCPDELEMENSYRGGKTSLEEASPRDKECNPESKKQLLTSDSTIIPSAKNGLHGKNTNGNHELEYTVAQSSRSSDEPKEMLGIHYLFFNEKSPAMDGPRDMIDSNCVAECEIEHDRAYVCKNLASVSGGTHASGYAMPRTSFNGSSDFDEILEKERQKNSGLESMMGSEYVKLDEVETQMYDAMTGEDLVSLSATPPMGSQFLSEFCIDLAQKGVNTTVCVWCGGEFCHEFIDIELQPDSVGFMCPSCRNKISKQFNELECNFSLNSKYY